MTNMKTKAITCMKRLKIAPDKIRAFSRYCKVAVYNECSGFSVPNTEQQAIISKVEHKVDGVVYFVAQDLIPALGDTSFKVDSYLYINEEILEKAKKNPEYLTPQCAWAYMYNYDEPMCSEYGSIMVLQTCAGGLIRMDSLIAKELEVKGYYCFR